MKIYEQSTCAHLTVKQFVAHHAAFTTGGIRSLIFNEDKNGLSAAGAILRVGRKVLIHQERFFTWIDQQNTKKAA